MGRGLYGDVPPPPTVTLDAASSPEANAALTDMLHALQDALRAEVGADGPSVQVRAAYERALAAYDRYIAVVLSAHPARCAAGCAACCRDNPRGVTGIELAVLSSAVDALPDAERVHAGFAALEARAAAEGGAEVRWRARGAPCPLLGPDARCRAYAARPIACRAFHAFTSPEWCAPAHPRFEDRVNPHLDPPRVLMQALQVLSLRHGLVSHTDLHAGVVGRGRAQ